MIIAISNQKGGTGKTTTCINLGKAMVELGYRVLLIDLDPQGHLSFSLGVKQGLHNITNLFTASSKLSEVIIHTEGLDFIGSDSRLANVELSLSHLDDRHLVLRELIRPLDKIYDLILLDCPPSLSLLTINALCASEGVIIPTLMETLSLKGISLITKTIDELNNNLDQEIRLLGVLPVEVDKRRNQTSELMQILTSGNRVHVFDASIPMDVKLSEAPSFGKSALMYAPECRGARAYRKAAHEIIDLVFDQVSS